MSSIGKLGEDFEIFVIISSREIKQKSPQIPPKSAFFTGNDPKLCGLYSPTTKVSESELFLSPISLAGGGLYVDGVDIRHYNLRHLRQHMALVILPCQNLNCIFGAKI